MCAYATVWSKISKVICYENIENCYILRRGAVLSGMCTDILEEPASSNIFDMPTNDGDSKFLYSV
jgi:tRNA(Arg) A34 adenosine deaminase TadA